MVGAAILFISAGSLAFWFFRRRPYSALSQQRPVNVLQDDDDRNEDHDLPQYYAPEPYLVPDPTIRGTSEAASTQDRPLSMSTVTADVQRPLTPMTTTTTTNRKSAAIPQLRPVNIIQHDDAGPSEYSGQPEPETIELPPAYTNIRQPQSSPLASTTPTAGEDES